jgi:hypothetical protein
MYIGFEVLTKVVMKGTIFWDITPCSPLKANQHFGEKHVQEGSNLQYRRHEATFSPTFSA